MQLSLPRVMERDQHERVSKSDAKTRAVATTRRYSDPFIEEFRLLAMNVLALLEGNPRKAITIFSHGHGDGRTRIAVELSRALAQHTDVLLIDGQASATGLHESLLITGPSSGGRQPDVAEPLIPTDQRRLWLSAAPHDGAGGDLAHRMKEAMAAGMMVIIDAPPSEASSDAFMLAQRSQNVLYVMRNKPQDMAPHRRAMDHLRRLDARVLGIVLNDR
jgi:Mrp family chromosome partitioning ATPase